MQIDINADKTVKTLDNFWNHIHFHPTDAAEDRWGKAILENIAKDRVANFVRLHAMLEDIVSRDKDGKLAYDFTESDARLDHMVRKGFKLLICFDFMPVCIAADPMNFSAAARYKGKRFNYSQPANYNEWAQVCYTYTKHLIERYGIDTVSTWYFHCWNEPDSGYWLNSKGNDKWDEDGDTDKLDEYIKLYDYFVGGVLKATDKIRIGGPSVAGSDRFFESFIKHVKDGVNSVSGEKGARCDFISIHCYSQGIYSKLPNKTYVSPGNILQRLDTLHTIMAKHGFGSKEIVFDEWGIAGGGFIGIDRDPRMIFRETEYFSAFFARLIDLIIRKPELNLTVMMICLSGQHKCVRDFDGYRTFFTLNGFKKPIYNAYALYAGLGSRLLDYAAEESTCTGVIPTADGDGGVKILVYHQLDEFDGVLGNVKVRLNVKGLSGEYELRHYRIDKTTSNSYSKWSELGRPENPDFSQREAINEAGELSLFYPPEKIRLDGSFSGELVMTKNSVSLIELLPVKNMQPPFTPSLRR